MSPYKLLHDDTGDAFLMFRPRNLARPAGHADGWNHAFARRCPLPRPPCSPMPRRASGRGLRAGLRKNSGFTLVELMIVLAIIAIIAAFAIPNLMLNRMAANETGAIGTLRSLISAQSTYMNRNAGMTTDLAGLASAGLIDNSLATVGFKTGYIFGELSTGSSYKFTCCAAPDDDGRSGVKEYCVNERGTVYEGNFSSSAIAGTRTTNWTSLPSRPTQFVVDPENYGSIWNPVSQ